jgi:ribosomal protein L35
MPKLKTHQATSKRFRVTKNGKIKKQVCGHGHFNAREEGKVGRQKKHQIVTSKRLNRIIQITLPNA